MRHFHWFKGFIFIALACTIPAFGSTVVSVGSENNQQKSESSAGYTIKVSAEQVQNTQASANLTISGENSKVSVERKGTVTLVAGKSIVLLPGTKISNGGFLYASIEPREKSGKRQKKEVKLVTIEEKMKIEEQASLCVAYSLFSPFLTRNKGYLHTGDAENGSFSSSYNDLSGVAPEQQRKVAVDSRQLPDATHGQRLVNYFPLPVAYMYRAEITRVLRL